MVKTSIHDHVDELYCLYKLGDSLNPESKAFGIKKDIIQYRHVPTEIDLGNKFTNWTIKAMEGSNSMILARTPDMK
jgi:hypothetical protein